MSKNMSEDYDQEKEDLLNQLRLKLNNTESQGSENSLQDVSEQYDECENQQTAQFINYVKSGLSYQHQEAGRQSS
jgi:hypothetical protein